MANNKIHKYNGVNSVTMALRSSSVAFSYSLVFWFFRLGKSAASAREGLCKSSGNLSQKMRVNKQTEREMSIHGNDTGSSEGFFVTWR